MNTQTENAAPDPASNMELLAELFRGVWSALTALDLRPRPMDAGPHPGLEDGPTGLVQISGGWAGTVVVRLTTSLGGKAAAAMLGLQDQEPPPEDIRDVTGEITNVFAGKLKATLPGRSQLSLPTVVDGRDYRGQLEASRPLLELWFESSGQVLAVSVWKRQEEPAR
jgi:CheY-specific phosphatase CheX